MGLFDELRKLARPYDEDEDYEEDEDDYPEEEEDEGEEEEEPARRNLRRVTPRPVQREPVRPTYGDSREIPSRSTYGDSRDVSSRSTYGDSRDVSSRSTYGDSRDISSRSTYGNSYGYEDVGRRSGSDKVVNIHTTTQLQVVLVKPEKFENASNIADHLREKRTVVLNLESTNKDIARRLVDFLSGVAYAQEGKIKKISAATYIITPYNVDIIGDLIDELENSGLYF